MMGENVAEKHRVYEMVLRHPLAAIGGPCALYTYTILKTVPFALVHTAASIAALMDWLRVWLQEEIAEEMRCDDDFWWGADAAVLAIADMDLRAFAHYAIHKPIAPVYRYDQCLYLEGLLDALPGYRFVMGWEARAPRQDRAYGIVEHVACA